MGEPAEGDDRILAGSRVLVVEDNPENRTLAERVLSGAGVAVTAVDGGEAAIEILSRRAFDLVLLDLRMPGLDGYATARRIRAAQGADGRTPLVAVSADPTSDVLHAVEAAGFDGHLAKPFRIGDLRRAVARHLSGRPDGGEPPSTDASRAVLNQTVLSEAVEFVGVAAVRTIVDGFLERLPARLLELEACRGIDAFADALHGLAGAAGTVGLMELSEVCKRGESRVRDHAGRRIDAVGDIRTAAARAEAVLRRFRSSL